MFLIYFQMAPTSTVQEVGSVRAEDRSRGLKVVKSCS